jgi:pSer/pThr/pTyr-binding forkhead associated (FHA) protein
MSARLVGWVEKTRRVEAAVGAQLRIGGADDNDLVLALPGISRAHARIVRLDREYTIEDAGSRNGTLVNGQPITRARLRHLDVIAVAGLVDMVFLDPSSADPGATVVSRRVSLEAMDGPEAGHVQELTPGAVVLGRSEAAGLLVESAAVSRAHAQVTFHPTGITLEDLESANGTSLNGQPVSGIVPLRDGDEFELGAARRFRVHIEAASPYPVPDSLDAADADPVNQTDKIPTSASRVDKSWRTRMAASDETIFAGTPAEPPRARPRVVATPEANSPAAQTTFAPLDLSVPRSIAGEPAVAEPQPRPRGVEAPWANLAKPAGKAPFPPSAPTMLSDMTWPGTSSADPSAPASKTSYIPLDLSVPSELASPSRAAATLSPRKPMTTYVPMSPSSGVPQGVLDGAADSGGRAKSPTIAGVRLSAQRGEFALPVGRSQIGRATDSALRLDLREVSRVHAAITVTDDEVRLEDLRSENGTRLNGRLINGPVRLESGDRVAFGDLEFKVDVLTEGDR